MQVQVWWGWWVWCMYECGDLLARRLPGGVSAGSCATAGVPGWGSALRRAALCVLGLCEWWEPGLGRRVATRAVGRAHCSGDALPPHAPPPMRCLLLLPPASPACMQLSLLHNPRRHLRRVVPPRLLQVGGWWVEWCVCGGGYACFALGICVAAWPWRSHTQAPPAPSLSAAGTGRRACRWSAAAPAPRGTTPRASGGL